MVATRPPGLAEKLRRIESVTDAALSGLELDDLLVELLDRTRELLSVDTAAIMLVDPSGTELAATASSGLEEEVRRGIRVPVGTGFVGRIAASGEPLVIDHVDSTTVFSPILIDRHLATLAGVPMFAAGQIIGVLYIGSEQPRAFTDDDIALLRLVADRAALATLGRLSRLDRATTLALQRSLLPSRPQPPTGFDTAARYIPGAEVGVGGDWYDLFALPSGYTGIVIGDVVGNGMRAAIVMGRIRSALRAYALETDDPADVLTRLDHKIQVFEPGAMATAIYAVLDPSGTILKMSVAGHPPPLHADGNTVTTLTAPPDPPLGATADAARRTTTISIGGQAALLFYTDGLVERRDRTIEEAIADLCRKLPAAPTEAAGWCDAAITATLGNTVSRDDVALLALRRTH